MISLRAARIFDGEGFLGAGEVLVEDGRIVGVTTDPVGLPDAPDAQLLDLGDVTLAPGFVDVHCHGGGGASFADDPDVAIALHRSRGTTSVVASLVTQSLEALDAQVRSLAPLVEAGELVGIHLEGPWLAELFKGAHPAERLRDPVASEVAGLLDAAGGAVRMVTIAVERPGALEAVRLIAARGAVAALGHSDCSYEDSVAAIDAGVTGATHLFNAMPGLHHRSPGPILALLADERVRCEIILDGVHVHPALVAEVLASNPRAILVTDAMAATGCADGDYVLGERHVEVRGGVARIAGTDTIAGSTTTLAASVRLAVESGITPGRALRAATSGPADHLGLAGVGRLQPGHHADLVVLDDAWTVRRVMRRGSWLS